MCRTAVTILYVRFFNISAHFSFVVSPNQQYAVYCTAMKYGSSDDWDYLWNKLQKTNFEIEKVTIMSSLVCSRNTTQLNRYVSDYALLTNYTNNMCKVCA